MTEGLGRWEGRAALVTGASSGIGRAVALRLGRAGMHVVLAARREERLAELRKEIEAGGGRALPVAIDLREPAQIDALFDRARTAWGGVDVLVNAAGLGHLASLVDGETEAWREMLDVNVLALTVCTREAVRDMRRRGDDGHVIHVSSMSGHRVTPMSGMYAATKFAVRALTEALRQELRDLDSHIRVSAVSPGFVETEFHEKLFESADQAREIYERYPVLQPEDVADTVAHLLGAPPHVQVHDVLVRPTRQPS